jgi:hypothetical protein
LVFKNQGKNLRTQETLVFFKKSVDWVGEKDENQQKTREKPRYQKTMVLGWISAPRKRTA